MQFDELPPPRPLRMDWGNAILSGLVGGAAFLALEMWLTASWLGEPPWGPLRMIAAILLGPNVLPPPSTFETGILVATLTVHVPLSILYALVLDAFLRRMRAAPGLLLGAIFGVLLYFLNFYSFAPFFPWFGYYRGPHHLLAHVGYGVVTAGAYELLHAVRRRRHAGEAPGVRKGTGQVLDPAGVAISTLSGDELAPTLAPSGTGGRVAIFYTRFDQGSNFGTDRVRGRFATSGAAIGASCTLPGDCATRNCADSYCCDTACNQTCQTCNATPGTCTTVRNGDDPDSCTGASTCDTSGACKKIAQGCTLGTECASTYCVDGVCCNAACSGGCDVCNAGGTVGTCSLVGAGSTGANPSCAPYVCSGTSASCPTSCTSDAQCASNAYCNSLGTCQLQQQRGQSCNLTTDCRVPGCRECATGFCVDGFCCNSACSGACDTCSDLTALGQCTVVPAGNPGNPSCAPYLCTGSSSSCGTSCTSDAQCAPNAYCNAAGQCQMQRAAGQMCNLAADCRVPGCRECATGNCVDGVCCQSACNQTCQTCQTCAGGTGACTTVRNADDNDTCTGANTCDPNGICKRKNGQVCTAGSDCASNNCVDGVCCNTACASGCDVCDAPGMVGTCTLLPRGAPGANPSCAPYVCSGTAACLTSCTTDAGCAAKRVL